METTDKTEKAISKNDGRKRSVALLLVGLFVVAGALSLLSLMLTSAQIYAEQSSIEAPVINLSSASGGTLRRLSVKAGEYVGAHAPIAEIGNDIVTTADSGIILSVVNAVGQEFAPQTPVATMIRPDDLRVVAQVEEDKGLSDIRVGQPVFFTVDAFGARRYTGVVDEVSPTARSGDIVFNISNTRQEQQFDVKIRFDVAAHPELVNGLSAKVWIYKR